MARIFTPEICISSEVLLIMLVERLRRRQPKSDSLQVSNRQNTNELGLQDTP